MRVLIGCEYSGVVREAFRKRGFDAWSCDLLPTEIPGPHLVSDIFDVLHLDWDAMIFFWPCTYLCRSGQQWLTRLPKNPKPDILYGAKRMGALLSHAGSFKKLLNANIRFIAGENPRMNNHASPIVGPSSQKIQPWQFGHGECKETHLWLKNLPPLIPTNVVEGREQRIFKMSPGPNRGLERSRTYQGIADAMAEQWGDFMLTEAAGSCKAS